MLIAHPTLSHLARAVCLQTLPSRFAGQYRVSSWPNLVALGIGEVSSRGQSGVADRLEPCGPRNQRGVITPPYRLRSDKGGGTTDL